jgi:hypothetical protein
VVSLLEWFIVTWLQERWSHDGMVSGRMVFGLVVGEVVGTRAPVATLGNHLGGRGLGPSKSVPMALDRFCLMVLLAKPVAVELSAWMGVGGW